jgi:hypothetical protein
MAVNNIISWESDDGSRRCILLVKDEEKNHNEIGYKKLELSKYDSDDDSWKTEETIDSVSEIESFGIPSLQSD